MPRRSPSLPSAAAAAVRPHHRWALCSLLPPLLLLLLLAGFCHRLTPPHHHISISPRPFHNTKDRTLSPSVDTTLRHLETTLKEHRVPFATGQLRPRTTSSTTIDLSSIQRMMNAFGDEQRAGQCTLQSITDGSCAGALELTPMVHCSSRFLATKHVGEELTLSGNVLVSSSLRAKITDFGSICQCFTRDRNQQQRTSLSSTASDDPQYSQQAGLQTMTSTTLTAGVGTSLYMAPEALTGDKYSFETDIFSFGVLMWEVATQRPPDLIEQEKGSGYRGPILATISNLMKDGKRLRFDDGEEDAIPEWFQSLTYKCMAQDPRERPSFGDLKDHHFA
ncbi:serine/threonine protein kinase [Salpingoeca rosetta]|uniref:Serine/threonine protein kinase n=1 Tax=Salpingoeca rosetta (strain ATCC 50818 / BSB-021) TaxID=946362 RepID=F2U3U2_SALR5|nr:serine/threonine protein kinase [Salpingoeca rosetta]EGD82286.1 serine/threonine protein kinase [Salpingoeca rosetta]|eukprot:XP_004996469.1 serine/threonine protein kinase [Salpingoeca rosetta]